MKKIWIFLLICFFMQPIVLSEQKIHKAGEDVSVASIAMTYKNINQRWRGVSKLKKQSKSLSDADKSTIKKYVFGAVRGEDTFQLINCYLNNTLEDFIPKKEITKPLKCRLEYYANNLCVSVSKAKLPQNIILYKGVNDKQLSSIFRNIKLNDIIYKPVTEENLILLKQKLKNVKFEEKGFISTYYDIDSVKNTKFLFEIRAPKNLQAVLTEDLGTQNKKEVLINRDSCWEVINVYKSKNKYTKKDMYVIVLKFVRK